MISSDIKFGILFYPPSFECEWASVVEAAVAVEKGGFDSFWTFDSYSDPMTILSAAVSNTKKLRIGTCVISPLFRYPAILTRDLSTLDNISGGRLTVGLGTLNIGSEKWGVPSNRPVTRLLESIEIMKKLWTENNVTYNGKFYKLENFSLSLKPFRKPHPPIWIDASTHAQRMLRITAIHANGWIGAWRIGTVPCTPKNYLKGLTLIRRIAEKNGRDPQEIDPVNLSITSISLDHDTALKLIEPLARNYVALCLFRLFYQYKSF